MVASKMPVIIWFEKLLLCLWKRHSGATFSTWLWCLSVIFSAGRAGGYEVKQYSGSILNKQCRFEKKVVSSNLAIEEFY